MKILIAPDSFKGSLTSIEICEIVTEGLGELVPEAEIVSVPVADGGEGTLEAFNTARPGRIVHAKATDPWFNETEAPYLFYNEGGDAIPTAIIESAKVAGFLTSASDPTRTTTYGVGLLIKDALSRGARKIIVGLGGSCTNDGGCGMAAALGTKFYGISSESDPAPFCQESSTTCRISDTTFIPTGGTLSDIAYIDNSQTTELLGGNHGSYLGKAVDIIGMCDVSNSLCGMNGAARVFAPQKGATAEDVDILDKGLEHLVSLIDDSPSMPYGDINAGSLANLPGSGAAGGLGFGIRAFTGGRLKHGIDLMLDTVDFDEQLWNADLVITGEGRFDSQSLQGKVVSGVCARAARENVPVIILCGTSEDIRHHDTTCINHHEITCAGAENIQVIETGSIDFTDLTAEQIKISAKENLLKVVPLIAKTLKKL